MHACRCSKEEIIFPVLVFGLATNSINAYELVDALIIFLHDSPFNRKKNERVTYNLMAIAAMSYIVTL